MKIAVAGCTGRMGLTLVNAALATQGITLAAGSERVGFDDAKARAQFAALGAADLFITSDNAVLVGKADGVIDFTTPEATLAIAKAIAEKGGVHVIGTTGMSDAQIETIRGYAGKSRIVMSGNFSLGVNLLESLIEQASKILDDSYDVEISEMHHKHKKDAPSGTALMLGRAAAAGRGVKLNDKKVVSRDGITGERTRGDIGFSVQRGGDVVGIHNVMFAGPGEVIELKHQGFSREIYANGALHAALWAAKQKPGFYSMKDVLGF